MKPLINWDELEKLVARSYTPVKSSKREGEAVSPDNENMWDRVSDFYNKMAMMELPYTVPQIECLGITQEDTVLDMGCGPGRISILAAERAASVTAADSAEKMLALCKKNAQERKIDNLKTVMIDWNDVQVGKNMDKHDFVIASRTEAMRDTLKLSSLANKCAAIMIFANAPSIPQIVDTLFEGITKEPSASFAGRDRRISYNVIYNKIYDLGYEPNVKILTDGFTKVFPDKETAYDFLLSLRPETKVESYPIAKKNFDNYLTLLEDGTFKFCIETRSCVIWWSTQVK